MAAARRQGKPKPAAKAKPAAKRKAPAAKVNPVPAARILKDEARWQAEDDLRTLRRAEEIRASKDRLKKAQAIADAELKALQAIRNGIG